MKAAIVCMLNSIFRLPILSNYRRTICATNAFGIGRPNSGGWITRGRDGGPQPVGDYQSQIMKGGRAVGMDGQWRLEVLLDHSCDYWMQMSRCHDDEVISQTLQTLHQHISFASFAV